jgi:hypothetical protein
MRRRSRSQWALASSILMVLPPTAAIARFMEVVVEVPCLFAPPSGRAWSPQGLPSMSTQASTGGLNWATAFSLFTSPVITMPSWFESSLNIRYAFGYTLSLVLFEGSSGKPAYPVATRAYRLTDENGGCLHRVKLCAETSEHPSPTAPRTASRNGCLPGGGWMVA